MSIQKMEFHVLDVGVPGLPRSISVQYNPSGHSEQIGAMYKPHEALGQSDGQQEYSRTSSKKLSFELYFDTTHEKTVRDVKHTWVAPLEALTKRCVPIQGEGQADKLRPPLVKLTWRGELLVGHVEDVKTDYLMYAECGTPLRARVNVSMVQSELPKPVHQGGPLSHLSANGIQLVIAVGGTLNELAARLGVDFRRLLADNPHIDDPMNLTADDLIRVTRAARRIHYEPEAQRRIGQKRWVPEHLLRK
ncbi:MAG: hypothetical protein H6741_10630 [Alphaproteobacteria bacterium]|nr:hypothetical protein [Alphaproteobacteria bacterium]